MTGTRHFCRSFLAALTVALSLSGAAIARAETYDPQAILAEAFPGLGALRQMMKPQIKALEARLDAEEQAGADRTCLRQAVTELRWRLNSTNKLAAAVHTRQRLFMLAAAPTTPAGNIQAYDGSYGPCVETWFWKLDASTDRFLGDDPVPEVPRFLDQVNDPVRLDTYLQGLLHSNLRRDGIDNRKELNLASADLVRLILRHKPANYPWRADLEPVIRRFIATAQDPATGFFGERYEDGDREIRVQDLSVTFHMARYLDGKIDHWPELVDHLIAMKASLYPYGWLDQSPAVAAEIAGLVDWCLGTALDPDGGLLTRADGESWPDALYFTAAFLDEVGYFDPAKRYWTDRPLPDPTRVRAGLLAQARKLPADEPMGRAALDRLAGR